MKKSVAKKVFDVVNVLVLAALSLSCVLPFIHLLAISLSGNVPVAAGRVGLVPQDFTLSTYKFVVQNAAFITSFLTSLKRVFLGVPLNLLLVILTAYPLSKSALKFRARNFYAWFFIFTMLFVPTLIPSFVAVQKLHLLDTIWALVLPGALPIFNMIVMLNFFRNLPPALEEAALIDGAGHWRILWKIYVPLSVPAIATITLFCLVTHWNAWFDGIIYMNRPEHYPLQSYLQTIVVNPQQILDIMANNPAMIELLSVISNQTAKAAQLFVGMIPVLCAYPFLQKYFTTGLVMGSVKG